MAYRGQAPKGIKHGRGVSADWTEVPNTPYEGPSLDLPKHRRGEPKWQPQVEAWWETVRRMPHCILWEESDWLFALETAYMKNDWWMEYHGGVVHSTKSTEIRRREDQMGTTREARRKLRILYVDPPETSTTDGHDPEVRETTATVTELDSRRARIAV